MATLIEIIPQDNRDLILSLVLRLLTRLNEQAAEPWKRGAEMLVHNKVGVLLMRNILEEELMALIESGKHYS